MSLPAWLPSGTYRSELAGAIGGSLDGACTVKDSPPAALQVGHWHAAIGDEIVIVTRVHGGELSILRGAHGTPKRQHPLPATLEHVVPAPAAGPRGTAGPVGRTGKTGPGGSAGERGPAGRPGVDGRAAIRWLADWNEATVYEQGDGVRASDGLLYVSTVARNSGHDPAGDPGHWMSLRDRIASGA